MEVRDKRLEDREVEAEAEGTLTASKAEEANSKWKGSSNIQIMTCVFSVCYWWSLFDRLSLNYRPLSLNLKGRNGE